MNRDLEWPQAGWLPSRLDSPDPAELVGPRDGPGDKIPFPAPQLRQLLCLGQLPLPLPQAIECLTPLPICPAAVNRVAEGRGKPGEASLQHVVVRAELEALDHHFL